VQLTRKIGITSFANETVPEAPPSDDGELEEQPFVARADTTKLQARRDRIRLSRLD
jgi:hypothetical protein